MEAGGKRKYEGEGEGGDAGPSHKRAKQEVHEAQEGEEFVPLAGWNVHVRTYHLDPLRDLDESDKVQTGEPETLMALIRSKAGGKPWRGRMVNKTPRGEFVCKKHNEKFGVAFKDIHKHVDSCRRWVVEHAFFEWRKRFYNEKPLGRALGEFWEAWDKADIPGDEGNPHEGPIDALYNKVEEAFKVATQPEINSLYWPAAKNTRTGPAEDLPDTEIVVEACVYP